MSERTARAAPPLIVVSGLPASGKTTLAADLAHALRLAHFDKDHILETMFGVFGSADAVARQRLSRASDQVLVVAASHAPGAVLSSFWRHRGAPGASGTPIDAICALSALVIEIHCVCPPEEAARRFVARTRHSGHHDSARDGADLVAQFRSIAARGALFGDAAISVDTTRRVDIEELADRVSGLINAGAPGAP